MCGKAESHLGCCPVNPPFCTWININKNKSLHQVRVPELWGESRGTLRRMIQSTQWSAGKLLAKGVRQSRELFCAGQPLLLKEEAVFPVEMEQMAGELVLRPLSRCSMESLSYRGTLHQAAPLLPPTCRHPFPCSIQQPKTLQCTSDCIWAAQVQSSYEKCLQIQTQESGNQPLLSSEFAPRQLSCFTGLM